MGTYLATSWDYQSLTEINRHHPAGTAKGFTLAWLEQHGSAQYQPKISRKMTRMCLWQKEAISRTNGSKSIDDHARYLVDFSSTLIARWEWLMMSLKLAEKAATNCCHWGSQHPEIDGDKNHLGFLQLGLRMKPVRNRWEVKRLKEDSAMCNRTYTARMSFTA